MQHSSLQATLLLTVVFCASGVAAQGAGQTRRTIEVDGIEREYLLLVPENPNADPRALVFNLHGSGGNPEQQLQVSDFARLVAEHEFLAALPQGI
jgi:poly(3-hydroxybutyrate) depolymerase